MRNRERIEGGLCRRPDLLAWQLGLALVLGAVLLGVDRLGWRVVCAMFDRDRLITSTR